jgi:hypothetical protein
MEYKGWKYYTSREEEDDNVKIFHLARKRTGQQIEEIMLDYNPYETIMWYGDFCKLIDEHEKKNMTIDDGLKQFIDDVCIVIQGKRSNYYPRSYENQVVSESYSRLAAKGLDLITNRAAQLKYDNLQLKVTAHKIQCKEDGIQLKED